MLMDHVCRRLMIRGPVWTGKYFSFCHKVFYNVLAINKIYFLPYKRGLYKGLRVTFLWQVSGEREEIGVLAYPFLKSSL